MLRYKKPFWLAAAVIGGVFAAASLAMLIVCLVQSDFSVLRLAVLGLMVAGGGLMMFFAMRTLPMLEGVREPAAVPNKQREQALVQMESARAKVGKSFSRCASALILLLSAVVFLWAYGHAQETEPIAQSTVISGIQYEKGEVLAIVSEYYRGDQAVEDVPVGNQVVTVEITSGDHAGERYDLKNNLSYLYGTMLEVGDDVTVSFSLTEGEIDGIQLQDYDRTSPLLLVLLAFIVITVLIGGKVGAKSLLGLGLTILCLFAVLIPLLLQGWPTIPTVLGMCALVTVVEFTILGGVSKKITCAILGTISGVVFAALFGQLACSLLRVNGFQMYSAEPTIEALLQIKQTQDPMHSIQIGDLLVGCILIAALGAVNDVAMSISSAMNELICVNPNLSRKELFKSGMNIGRDMVGTMTNTLILALVGGGLILMIYLTSLTPSLPQLMSSSYLAVEMVQAIASSVGVILAVPLSVVIGMVLFGRPLHRKKTST